MEIRFKLKSHDYRVLDSAVFLFKQFCKESGFDSIGPIFFKKKRGTYVFLRSPHVNKKAREHFQFITYNCLVVLKKEKLSEKELDLFLKKINFLNIPGVSVRIIKINKN
jgi:small subunit ribosomal protein S10